MIKQLLSKNEFAKNVLTLMTGTVLAQMIPLLIMPVLTRIYNPDEFGQYAIFMSVVGILSVIATARYEVAIMLPRQIKNSLNVLFISIAIAALFSLFVLVFMLVSVEWLKRYLAFELLLLIPSAVFFMAVLQSLKMWINRNQKYKRMAIVNIEQSFYSGGSQLSLSLINNLNFGLMYGQVAGHVLAALSLFRYCRDDFLGFRFDKRRLLFLLKKYSYLVKFGVPALLTSRVAQESLVFLIAAYMGNAILGLVVITQRVVSIPSSVIATNLSSVFYEKISRYKKEKSYPLVSRYVAMLSGVSVLIFLIYYVVFSLLFVAIFGSEWEEALNYAPYLFVVAMFSFIFSPVTVLFNYYETQKWNLLWQSAWLISNVLVFSISDSFGLSIELTFLIYAVSQSFLYALGIVSFLIYAKGIYEK